MIRLILACLCAIILLASACIVCLAVNDGDSTVNPTVVRHDLREILSHDEYNRNFTVQTDESFIERLQRKIGAFLIRLFGTVGRPTGKMFSFVLACLVILSFLVLVALVLVKLKKYMSEDAKADNSLDIEGYDLPSARPLITEAEKLADSGDYRGAFRCAYLASISHLDEARALRFERSRTNWEYLRELVSSGFQSPHDHLRPLTLAFDRKFYGGEPCTRQDYENALVAYERIASEVAAV